MSHILEVEGLTTVFDGDGGQMTSADGISFYVDPGEIVCIVGESGCGKSVTSLSLMSLLGRGGKVRAGKALFEGRDLLSMSEKELDKIRGDAVTMIFQDPLTSLNPVFTIGRQITESIRVHMHLDKEAAFKRAVSLLEKVGMPDAASVMKKYPHLLSGGQRQRVMIAMALSCRPRLLIADEPTTALDVTIQAQIMQLLKELQKDLGMAVILITHDIGLVAQMADRVLVMYAGQIIEQAPVLRLFDEPGQPRRCCAPCPPFRVLAETGRRFWQPRRRTENGWSPFRAWCPSTTTGSRAAALQTAAPTRRNAATNPRRRWPAARPMWRGAGKPPAWNKRTE